MGRTIRAAGGVVWRYADKAIEVAVVHRPRYDDWSLPKGKARADETRLEAAVREVGEETGASAAVQRRIGQQRYDVAGVPKKVTYWSMRYLHGQFTVNDEVDELRWLPVRAARSLVTYEADASVLDHLTELPLPDALIVLVRHAKAGHRSEWTGEDAQRPLDRNGARQAARLATLLRTFDPQQVCAADRVRCVSTVEPLAAALGTDVQVEQVFTDEAFRAAPDRSEAALLALAKPGTVSVVCSQGDAIPGLLERLGPGVRATQTRKGAWWVLAVADGEVVGLDPYDAP